MVDLAGRHPLHRSTTGTGGVAAWPPGGAGILGDVAVARASRPDSAPPGPPARREVAWSAVETDRATLLGLELPDAPARHTWWWQPALRRAR